MTEIVHGMASTPTGRRFGMHDLSQLAGWGLATLAALTLATYAASFPIGEDRLILAVASIRGVPPPERLAHTPADRQARQLADAVRELSADRDQLLARLDTVERNIGEVTGSIARAANPPTAAPPIAVAPVAVPTVTAAPEPPAVASTSPAATPDISLPRTVAPAAPEEIPVPIKPEFGIDLGRANSVDGLRQLWGAMKSRHVAALEGLRPIIVVREIARAGGIELRLVAGPLSNAAAAARLCATLAGATCHPTVFDGQRLALR